MTEIKPLSITPLFYCLLGIIEADGGNVSFRNQNDILQVHACFACSMIVLIAGPSQSLNV